MEVTARQLNRTTLQRQLLLEREQRDVVDTVRHLVGLQAQQAVGPYLALWNRVVDFDPAELDAAFAEHRIVKASLLRVTLHAVAAQDHAVVHRAVVGSLRGSRLGDRRFTRTGLTIADADDSIEDLLVYLAEPRSNAELEAWYADRFPDMVEPGIWWALRTYAPLIHAPASHHPWSYGLRPSYRAVPLNGYEGSRADAMVELARRYLAAYGPATAADLGLFSTLIRAPAKEAFETLGDELVRLRGPDGKPVFDLAGAALAEEDLDAPPRLLGMWDNALLAHTDRTRLIPEEYRRTVIRNNGDVLPMLLVDGYVAGVWRPVETGIEATAFRRLPRAVWSALAAEAADLKAMLAEREPLVFSRYGHWWKTIGGEEVRVL